MSAVPASPPMTELVAPPGWRTVDFISDLHLHASEPATFAAWQRYLDCTPADAVFILGDLFETWVGDDSVRPGPPAPDADSGFEDQCARVLARASTRLAVFFMHGNRDFLVGQPSGGQSLMSRCGLALLADPTVLVFSGQRWLLSHGDALCLADQDYLEFRQQVRSPAWQQRFLAQPLPERQAIARSLRAQSQAQHQRRMASGVADADVDTSAARQWLRAAQAHTLIHGHTHRPAVHDLGEGLSRVVLSDWDAGAQAPQLPRAQALRLSADGLRRISVL